MFTPSRRAAVQGAMAVSALGGRAFAQAKPVTLLNVSYDPTRELYQDINKAFIAFWKQRTGQDLKVNQSHNGSGASARAVIDGLQADVVTLALAYDIDEISRTAHLLPANWQSRLPNNSTPYTSTIVFLVRQGNPWRIKDWGDLIKPGIEVIAPNPKTGGGARWIYLAAWAWAKTQPGGSDASAKAFVQQLYKHIPVLDTGSRGSTITFTERRIGDAYMCWENEAHLALDQLGAQYEIVTPPSSILAEPPVAVVDKNVDRHGARAAAEGYLNFLYSPLAQDIIGRRHYRPINPDAARKYAAKFPSLRLATIADFGGWTKAQATHFADGAIFDQIYRS
jgi:sulfate/thiosulfate transport system substrate-binding protein